MIADLQPDFMYSSFLYLKPTPRVNILFYFLFICIKKERIFIKEEL